MPTRSLPSANLMMSAACPSAPSMAVRGTTTFLEEHLVDVAFRRPGSGSAAR